MATHDDVYNGFFIPAGTIVVGNSWFVFLFPLTTLIAVRSFLPLLGQSSTTQIYIQILIVLIQNAS